MEEVLQILKNTFLITGLVMVMMLFIEYINVRSHGHSLERLQRSPFGQIVLAALLGLIPGCIGGFAAVSLFTHGIVNFGALVAMTIATTGDESFVLLAMSPATALLINSMLFVVAIAVGWLINRCVKKFPVPFSARHFEVHEHEQLNTDETFCARIFKNLRHISFQRALLLTGLLLFIIAMLSGLLEHSHGDDHIHTAECGHEHGPAGILFSERWLNILFGCISIVTFFLIASTDDHFCEEHLWGHIIKKHFFKIFLWTLGALAVVHLLLLRVDFHEWLSDNMLLVLFAAILIGLIPESGPHLIFISLYAAGSIPFSILLTSCVVQDGHTLLPLLAESPRAFVWVKGLKVVLGVAVGLSGYFMGF